MRPCTLLAALFLGAHGVPHGEHASSADGVVPRSPRELEPEDVDDIMQHQAQKEIEDEIKRKEQDLADKATKIAVIKAGLDSLAINEGIDCTTANQETMEGAMTCKFKEYYFKKSTASEIKYFTHNIVALALFIKMRGGMHRPRTGSIYASFDERPVDDPLHKKALLLENPASGEFVRVPIDLKEYFGMDKLPLMEIDKLRLFFSAGAEQMNVQSIVPVALLEHQLSGTNLVAMNEKHMVLPDRWLGPDEAKTESVEVWHGDYDLWDWIAQPEDGLTHKTHLYQMGNLKKARHPRNCYFSPIQCHFTQSGRTHGHGPEVKNVKYQHG